MKILFSNIILVSFFFISFQKSFCQSQNSNDLDNAYKQELLAENNALKSRIENFPAEAKTINAKIAQSIREKDYANALELSQELDNILPNNADVKNFKAKMYYKLNNLELAINSYDDAIQLNPKNKWFYINKAGILSEENRLEEALGVVNQLVIIEENWSIAYNLKASLLLYLKKQDEALLMFNKAINCKPESAQIYTNRGDLYSKMSDEKKAILDYKRALQIQPDYRPAKEKLNMISNEFN